MKRGTLALAGVAAILVAAGVGVWIGRTTADTDTEPADPRAQGQARVLAAELDRLRLSTLAALDDACWWPGDYRLKLSADDRRALAGQLSGRDWTLVSRALMVAEQIPTRRRDGFEWRAGYESSDMDLGTAYLEVAEPAIRALGSFADLPAQRPIGSSSRPREYARNGYMVPERSSPSPLCRE